MPAYELESTMQISPALALRAAADFAAWTPEGGDPAILAYDGLAYKYLDADSLTDDDLCFAQNHLRHMSALHLDRVLDRLMSSIPIVWRCHAVRAA